MTFLMISTIIFQVAILALGGVVCYLILKKNENKMEVTPREFLELLTILSSLIQSELDAYDKDIFASKGAITNNNFDNYYKDLFSKVLTNIPDRLIKQLSIYYTEDAVYKYIARTIRDYLVTKINGTV